MAINPLVKQLATKVRNAIYGSEVRESIAKSMEVTNELTEDTKTRQDNLDGQFQSIIDNTTGKDVVSAPEILASRVGEDGTAHASLKARLDDEQQKTTAQLAQMFINVKFPPKPLTPAKGDNVKDDRAAIQAILDYVESNGGGWVYLPIGVYKINGFLEIGSGVHLFGAGKKSVLNGIGASHIDTGSAVLFNKNMTGTEPYKGAVGFSVRNFAVNSETRERQGVLFSNASDYYVADIYHLGKTIYHCLDINFSKNALFERLYLEADPLGTAVLQFDSRFGANKNIRVKGVYINKEEFDPTMSTFTSKVSALHFHNGLGSDDIHISDVYVNGMEVVVFKDARADFDNILIENVTVENTRVPIAWHNATAGNRSHQLKLKNWKVTSDSVFRGVGWIHQTEGVSINEFILDAGSGDEEIALYLRENTDIEFDIKSIGAAYSAKGFSAYVDSDVGMLFDEHGTFLPKVTNTLPEMPEPLYTNRYGFYTRKGNMVHVNIKFALSNTNGLAGSRMLIKGLPFDTLFEDSRDSGVLGYVVDLVTDKSINFVLRGSDNGIALYEAGTNNILPASALMNTTLLSFSLTYIAK